MLLSRLSFLLCLTSGLPGSGFQSPGNPWLATLDLLSVCFLLRKLDSASSFLLSTAASSSASLPCVSATVLLRSCILRSTLASLWILAVFSCCFRSWLLLYLQSLLLARRKTIYWRARVTYWAVKNSLPICFTLLSAMCFIMTLSLVLSELAIFCFISTSFILAQCASLSL